LTILTHPGVVLGGLEVKEAQETDLVC
jgi:hypothetical protein